MKSFFKWAQTLKFRQLFYLTLTLLMLDIIVPDPIPFLDEIIFGLATMLLGSIKKKPGNSRLPD